VPKQIGEQGGAADDDEHGAEKQPCRSREFKAPNGEPTMKAVQRPDARRPGTIDSGTTR
jgi:hypothetical protein